MLDKLKDIKDLMKKAKDMKSEMKKIQSELNDLEKRLAYAFNQAAQKAKTLATNKLSSVSQGLNIPGL